MPQTSIHSSPKPSVPSTKPSVLSTKPIVPCTEPDVLSTKAGMLARGAISVALYIGYHSHVLYPLCVDASFLRLNLLVRIPQINQAPEGCESHLVRVQNH